MRTTPNLGLTVWDLNNDVFDSSQLAANWDAIDADYTRTRPANSVQVVSTLGSVPSPTEGTLAYLNAANGGFAAGTVVRYTSSTWKPVQGLEVLSAVPVSGNFAGRTVLLSSASGSFAQWSLISYNGSSWFLTNYNYEILSAVPGSGNYAGRIVMLSSASGGFAAFSLIRYDGSNWALIGPNAIPPASELLFYALSSDSSTTNTVSPGDTITTFSSTAFENVKYYLDVSIPWYTHSVSQGDARILLRESGTTITSLDIPTPNTASVPAHYSAKNSFVPTAGNHTYSLTYMTISAGTFEIFGSSHSNAIFRVVKA